MPGSIMALMAMAPAPAAIRGLSLPAALSGITIASPAVTIIPGIMNSKRHPFLSIMESGTVIEGKMRPIKKANVYAGCSTSRYFIKNDKDLADLREECISGSLLCGECKLRMLDRILSFKHTHNAKKEKMQDTARSIVLLPENSLE